MTTAKDDRQRATAEAEAIAERCVIGAVLIDETEAVATFDEVSALGIDGASFTSTLRAQLWRIMADKREAGDSINVADVSARACADLLPGTDADMVRAELAAAVDSVPSVAHGIDHAKECLRLAKARRQRRAIAEAARAIENGDGGAAQWLRERLDEIDARSSTHDFGRADLETEFREALEDAADPKRCRTIKTRFGGFDLITGGVEGGQLIVVSARPSIGKTTFAFAALRRFVEGEHGGRGAFISLEMGARPFMRGLIAEAARVPVSSVKSGALTDDDIGRAMSKAPSDTLSRIRFYAPSSMNVRGLCAAVRDAANRGGAKLVAVDYAGLLIDKAARTEERLQLGKVSQTCKALARELDITIMLLAQASRDVDKEGGGAQLHHLKGAADLEADADIVVFLENHEECTRGAKRQLVKWAVKKNRDGRCGSCWYAVDNDFRTVIEPPMIGENPTDEAVRRMHEINRTVLQSKKQGKPKHVAGSFYERDAGAE